MKGGTGERFSVVQDSKPGSEAGWKASTTIRQVPPDEIRCGSREPAPDSGVPSSGGTRPTFTDRPLTPHRHRIPLRTPAGRLHRHGLILRCKALALRFAGRIFEKEAVFFEKQPSPLQVPVTRFEEDVTILARPPLPIQKDVTIFENGVMICPGQRLN